MSAERGWYGNGATAVNWARLAYAQLERGEIAAAMLSHGFASACAARFDLAVGARLARVVLVERIVTALGSRLYAAIAGLQACAPKPPPVPRPPKRSAQPVPAAVARQARYLRQARRTRSGMRARPWSEIADELARQGYGRWQPADLSQAVEAHLAIDAHPLAPLPKREQSRIEQTWRDGWAAEFPGEPWPGLEAAQRKLRDRAIEKHNAAELEKLGAVKDALERAWGGR